MSSKRKAAATAESEKTKTSRTSSRKVDKMEVDGAEVTTTTEVTKIVTTSAEALVGDAQEEINSLRLQLQAKDTEIADLNKQIADGFAKAAKHSEITAGLNAKIAELELRVKESYERYVTIEKTVTILRVEKAEAEKKIAEVSKELKHASAASTAELDKLKGENHRLKDQVKEYKELAAKLEKEGGEAWAALKQVEDNAAAALHQAAAAERAIAEKLKEAQADDEYMDNLVKEKAREIADLKKAEAAMAKALAEAQADDAAMEKLISQKDKELKKMEAERRALAKQLADAKADDAYMDDLVKQKDAELQKLAKQKEALAKKLADAEADDVYMDKLVKDQKSKLDALHAKEKELADKLKAAQADDKYMEDLVKNKDEQIAELQSQIKQLTSVIRTTQIEIKQLIASREGLIARLEGSAAFYEKIRKLVRITADLEEEANKEYSRDLDCMKAFGGAITVTIATIVEETTTTTATSSAPSPTKAKGRK